MQACEMSRLLLATPCKALDTLEGFTYIPGCPHLKVLLHKLVQRSAGKGSDLRHL